MSSSLHVLQPYTPGLGDGQPGSITLAPSLSSIPAGLEAILEFNGLYLNVRQNVDRYRVNSIDGLQDADIRDARDPNTDDDGETPYNAYYGGRTIVISGVIETYSVGKLRDMQQALRTAFATLTEKSLYFRLGDFTKDHFINCRKVSSIAGIEQQSSARVTREFQVSLRASNPRFLSFYEKFFDAKFTTTHPVQTQIGTAINKGNYSAQPIWRIYGPATTSVITNGISGDSFGIGSIPFGSYIEYDTQMNTVKDAFGNNAWNYLTDDSDSMYIQPGSNPILYVGDASRVQASWRDSWM